MKGLNALIGVVSTPTAAPVIAATRLRKGATNSARGAARLVADTLATALRGGASGLILTRADSAFYNADVVAATSRGGSRFSLTARSARRLVIHLPTDWPWEQAWTELFTHACGPPAAAT